MLSPLDFLPLLLLLLHSPVPANSACTGAADEVSSATCCPHPYQTWDTTTEACVNCEAGHIYSSDNTFTCAQRESCPAGTFSDDPAVACAACSTAGVTYAATAEEGRKDCTSTPCPAGGYCPTNSATPSAPVLCPAGTSSATVGASDVSTCTPCENGSLCPVGSATPAPCAVGTVSDDPTDATCTTCGATTGASNEFSDATGATACGVCETEGMTYQRITSGRSDCTTSAAACPAGGYCPTNSATPSAAVLCHAGTSSASVSQSDESTCVSCNEDPHSGVTTGIPGDDLKSTTNRDVCDRCPSGFIYKIGASGQWPGGGYGRSDCLTDREECGAGSMCVENVRTICPAGTASVSAAASECSPCAANEYSFRGSLICTICEDGFIYNLVPGRNECTGDRRTCIAGYRCVNNYEETCPTGRYAQAGAASCTACDDGSSTQATGFGYGAEPAVGTSSAACLQCDQGTYWAPDITLDTNNHEFKIQALRCYLCPVGTYSGVGAVSPVTGPPVDGSIVYPCTECAAGESTAGDGSADISQCVECAAGKNQIFTQRSMVVPSLYGGFVWGTECRFCLEGQVREERLRREGSLTI